MSWHWKMEIDEWILISFELAKHESSFRIGNEPVTSRITMYGDWLANSNNIWDLFY